MYLNSEKHKKENVFSLNYKTANLMLMHWIKKACIQVENDGKPAVFTWYKLTHILVRLSVLNITQQTIGYPTKILKTCGSKKDSTMFTHSIKKSLIEGG